MGVGGSGFRGLDLGFGVAGLGFVEGVLWLGGFGVGALLKCGVDVLRVPAFFM